MMECKPCDKNHFTGRITDLDLNILAFLATRHPRGAYHEDVSLGIGATIQPGLFNLRDMGLVEYRFDEMGKYHLTVEGFQTLATANRNMVR